MRACPCIHDCRAAVQPVIFFMMASKMPSLAADTIIECHNVLDRFEAVDEEDPQLKQMIAAAQQVRWWH